MTVTAITIAMITTRTRARMHVETRTMMALCAAIRPVNVPDVATAAMAVVMVASMTLMATPGIWGLRASTRRVTARAITKVTNAPIAMTRTMGAAATPTATETAIATVMVTVTAMAVG